MALEPAKLSDFKVAGALGSGTTARVYEAVHIATGRPVAIKVMEQGSSTSEMRERFAREALLLAGVESRHVSKILGFGFDKGQPFLVLERLHGETLDAKLRRDGPVHPPIAVRWLEQLIVGVRDCHDAKIIHRDIKPSNIFIHHDGFDDSVKLIDFGVARLREIAGGDAGGLTGTNHLIGSMGYMAPEQFRSAKSVGFTADIYAIGVVMFRTLTGRLPFVSRSLEAVIKMKMEQNVPAISSLGIVKNQLLDWFVLKAMAREPEQRFQSAREMLEHWWNVVGSFDEDQRTDIMGGFGRVDESYAGPVPRQPGTAPPPTMPHVPPSAPQQVVQPPVPLYADGDARTQRRPQRGPVPLPSAATPSSGHAVPVSSDRTLPEEQAPRTVPSHDMQGPWPIDALAADGDETTETTRGPLHPGERDDPYDMPTRNDPNLRKLVERELELQKARKRGGT